MLHLSLGQQLQAPQEPQGLGLAVTAWEIHRGNGPQVSQVRNEHDFFSLGSEQMSLWQVFWVP